ncbi:MAG: TetR/AcrR family transcriptional regulator [Parvularculaceae bacterium]|nr:TetR/AcrR family transcriptional regulator [Parvularculaceae bacterium]
MPRLNLTEEETRALILDEADRLFTEIGYDKTTVADIAKACGFSSANVHRVFGTKAAINRAAAHRKLQYKLRIAQEAIDREGTARAKLETFVRTVNFLTYATFSENQRVHHMVACAIDERWEEVRQYRLGLLDHMRKIISHGVASGEFNVPDVEAAARSAHMSVMRYFHPLAVAEMEVEPDDASLDDWLDFALRGLGAKV